jgi:serine/threonine protein kinase/formylglycine-generating enzyme required for sulfatase activity
MVPITSETRSFSPYGCPSSDVLVEFILGQMSVAEVDRLGEHINLCTRCEALCDTLHKDRKTVFSRLRQAARRGSDSLGELVAESEFLEFAARACKIKFAPSIPTESTKVYSPQSDQPAGSCPEQIAHYLVTREIGRGGFGRVYLAHDPRQNRQVAIKVPRHDRAMSAGNLDRFLSEARIVATLNHPSIVSVLDWGTTDVIGPFVVMEYINGQTLAEVMTAGQLDHRSLIQIMINVAQALHHAHKLGLVHRDVKPQNILIDSAGRPFVVDFGLAIRDEEQWNHRGELAGTRPYMAPEQVRRESHRLDGRTDLWAMGVVLFQALTAKLPFSGATAEQLEDEIQYRDPKPPRQIDDMIPVDLERICLKCLSKKMTDRYTTALDLAGELQLTTEPSPTLVRPTEMSSATVVPRGVRSFGPEDQHFFLELLPGPRDALGLPDSIRSWKARLDATDPGEVSPIAVLYGPSGCGKSSFVRAGLLPRLGPHVVHIYIDAGGQDVDLRLLRTLEHKCRNLPRDATLVETVARLRSGNHFPVGCTKFVVVLDQFEQWLHTNCEDMNTPLIQALRQFDGEHVQCLILVRDDFWMALTRFMHELEIPLLEGRNSAAVDLFDARHARRVLTQFGRVFGTLPPGLDELSADQNSFVESAIEELASDGRVVCVRLALFAEMVKAKPWKPLTLKQLGGVAGVGVTFLEESFGRSAPARHRLHQQPIRAILAALLPKDRTEIRDHLQSRESLLSISGCTRSVNQFEDILRILDLELHLITPVDTELIESGRRPVPGDRADSSPSGQYYQLTHDYLVPSIRDWLNHKRRETMRGRAELLLEERARLWKATHDQKQLPSLLEWVQICCLTRRREWNHFEQQLMRMTSRFHGIRTAVGLTTLMVFSVIAIAFYGNLRGSWLIENLRTVETAKAESVIHQIQSYSFWTRTKLRDRPLDELDSSQQFRFDLASLALGNQVDLTNSIIHAAPQELELTLKILGQRRIDPALSQRLWAVLHDNSISNDQRFRAACGLANLDPENQEWTSAAAKVAELLLLQERHLADEWIELLRPIGHVLVAPLEVRFLQVAGQDPGDRYVAALALAEFCQQDQGKLVSFLKNSTSEQVLFLHKLEQDRSAAIAQLESEFATAPPRTGNQQERERFEIQRARLGTALILLGKPETVWPAFEHQPDPTLRMFLVDQLAAWHVDPLVLWKQIRQTSSASTKYALLLALGEYPRQEIQAMIGDDLARTLERMYEHDHNPGVHSATEWLMCRFGLSPTQAAIRRIDADASVKNRMWDIDQEGHSFAIINTPGAFLMGSPDDEADRNNDETQHTRTIDYSFAIATRPVTIAQYRRSGGIDRSDPRSDVNCPIDLVDAGEAMKYCNWLSSQNRIPETEWCYKAQTDGGKAIILPVDGILSKAGYRLPTEAESEYACRAGTATRRFCGNSQAILGKYAWYFDNSDGRLHAVAQLRPNEFGLFDVYGNAAQWCQTSYYAYGVGGTDVSLIYTAQGSLVYRGCTYNSRPNFARSARRSRTLSAPLSAIGFRVARTLH